VVTWCIVPVVSLVKYLALEPELHRKRPRAIAFTLAVVSAIVLLIGFIPWWVRIEAAGILEPQQHELMHARAGGFITQILAKDGETLEKGQPIIVCRDPDLEAQIKAAEAHMRGLHVKIVQSS